MQKFVNFFTAKTYRIIIFGLLNVLLGGLLAFYYFYRSPVKIEDYYNTEINYEKVYFKESANKIVIVSDTREFGLSVTLLNLQEKYKLSEVIKNLSSSSKAEIWLDDKNSISPFLRGIKTETFYLSPEIGTIKDNKDNKGFAELCFYFFFGGIIIILIGIIKFLIEKR